MLDTKWSFLVISQLNKGPRRFNQLRRSLDNVNTQSLTDTLRHLERHGLVRRRLFPSVPVTAEYSLTEMGEDFRRVLREMRDWRRKWKDELTADF
ncbi:helix-turn-helix transcriptional regulator [Paenibacillus sp. P26]|nr:helix-turn-helix transcriptional regulator [Paenibacillus sp. P26]